MSFLSSFEARNRQPRCHARDRRIPLAALCACLWLAPAAQAEDIVLGMSAAFTGPSRALGIELYRGSQAYLQQVNRDGGVHGRQVIIRALDDAYDPTRAIQNTVRLVEEDGVFALFNYVGTPTVTRVLPLLNHYASANLYLFFPFTGAEPQRRPPYADQVFNLRASYHDETAALVERMTELGRERIAVFYQADAFGRGGWEGVRNALHQRGEDIAGEATYHRGAGFGSDFTEQVRLLRASDPDAVMAVCAYAACAAFIRDARNAGWTVPIATLSFSGSEAMLELLLELEPGGGYTDGLIGTQVVPSYLDPELAAIPAYRRAMEWLGTALPEAASEPGYTPLPYSFASLEGYLNAMLIVRILQDMGPDPDRSAIRQAAEGLRDLDLGIGAPVSFSPDRHQGLARVYFTRVDGERFVPLRDWSDWERERP